MKIKNLPDIYHYHDYQKYLGDVLDACKKSRISLRKLASEIGVTAAYLSMIRSGKRMMNFDALEKLSAFIGLNGAETSYFRSMITLSDSRDMEEKHDAYQRMKRHYKYRKNNNDSLSSYLYLTDWINVAIREMTEIDGFEWNFEDIKSRLPKGIAKARILRAMSFLKENGFVGGNETENPLMECEGGVFKLSLSKFHDEMLGKTVESIYEIDPDDRLILGHTLALSGDGFEEGRKILREALEKLQKLEQNKNNKKKVYHFSLSGIPVTR